MREVFAAALTEVTFAEWSRRHGRVDALIEERLGAIALSSKRWADVPDDQLAAAMLDGVRQLGLHLSAGAEAFRARVELVRQAGRDLPDMSDAALLDSLEDWLLPHLGAKCGGLEGIRRNARIAGHVGLGSIANAGARRTSAF